MRYLITTSALFCLSSFSGTIIDIEKRFDCTLGLDAEQLTLKIVCQFSNSTSIQERDRL